MQILLLRVKSFLLHEIREQHLNLVEIAIVKKLFLFRRDFEDSSDRLIIEQQVNTVHTLR